MDILFIVNDVIMLYHAMSCFAMGTNIWEEQMLTTLYHHAKGAAEIKIVRVMEKVQIVGCGRGGGGG